MSVVETHYEHIVLDDTDVPLVAGSTMKVVELVLERQAYVWSPKELHFQHPYLFLGQIYSALAFYSDHKEELDEDIARRHNQVEELRRTVPVSPLLARLKAHQ